MVVEEVGEVGGMDLDSDGGKGSWRWLYARTHMSMCIQNGLSWSQAHMSFFM